ncbi:hypothetical protein SAY87_031308 [Trapa incisa]|uniref:Large ribosomal subunit protein bL21m n=1 Tax=Trapa incisa TaxID=236973 RepID=A0AAN7QLC4_9MYRT|nr:hypothetical protein SAY87_031308 [Trapa incisa]
MASRRCLHALSRRTVALLSSTAPSRDLKCLIPLPGPFSFRTVVQSPRTAVPCLEPTPLSLLWHARLFSSDSRESDSEGEGDEGSESKDDTESNLKKEYSQEEKEAEAAAIGYKVVGQLQNSKRIFKPYEPVFAVVQIGSHQFKVSNDDSIFTERLKFCEVNDKLILNKVLLLGSKTQTIVGRPIVPNSAVHAVVEEHALDAKVIIFKKKRRKNYRRTKGHRQELTKLRIINIQGIGKPKSTESTKPVKAVANKPEKVTMSTLPSALVSSSPAANSLTAAMFQPHRTLKTETPRLIMYGFFLPRIPLASSFYMGTTIIHLVPHVYDLLRAHISPRFLDMSYIYANHRMDFYSTAWDVVIPFAGLLLAVIVYSQQRFGGRCILPKRFKERSLCMRRFLPLAMMNSFFVYLGPFGKLITQSEQYPCARSWA